MIDGEAEVVERATARPVEEVELGGWRRDVVLIRHGAEAEREIVGGFRGAVEDGALPLK